MNFLKPVLFWFVCTYLKSPLAVVSAETVSILSWLSCTVILTPASAGCTWPVINCPFSPVNFNISPGHASVRHTRVGVSNQLTNLSKTNKLKLWVKYRQGYNPQPALLVFSLKIVLTRAQFHNQGVTLSVNPNNCWPNFEWLTVLF